VGLALCWSDYTQLLFRHGVRGAVRILGKIRSSTMCTASVCEVIDRYFSWFFFVILVATYSFRRARCLRTSYRSKERINIIVVRTLFKFIIRVYDINLVTI